MKWLPLVLAILSVQLPAQTPWGTHGYCFPPGSPQPQPQGGNPNYASYNGSAFTPKGHLHILLVCVDFENFISVGFTPPIDPWGDQTYNEVWLKDNLPTLATPINGQSRVFNSSLPIVPGSPTQQHNFSEYYYLMSGGAFEVTGDVYPQAVVVDLAAAVAANGGNTDLSLLNVVNRKAMEKIVAIDPNFDWDKYDSRTNGPAFNEDNSNTSPDGVLDFVIFMYRSNPFFGNSANGMGSPGYFSFNTPNGTYWVKNGITGSSVEPTRLFWMDYFGHEIAHQIYATGSHHMGANGIHFDKPYFSNGWGIMSGMFSQFEVANAWEKWWLGWKSPVTVTTGGSYALKDATEHGQALRVKIPNTQLDSQLPDSVCEYLWIEYHSKQNYWDNKFDYNGLRPAPGIGEQSSPGLYMYITDRELADRKSPAGASQANGMMVYHKDGNFDMKRDGTFSVPFAFGGAPQPVFSQITRKDNPFAGTNVYWGQPEDLGGIYTPGTISAAFGEWNGYWAGSNLDEVQRTVFAEKMPSGIDLATYAITGNSGDAFGVGDVIGLSGVVPVLNYPAYDNSNHQLGSIYINGIRISIMGYDAVNDLYNLDIAFDAYEVETDKRWCGNLILPNLGNKPSGTPYELTVKPNVTLLIDQSETPNRFNTGSHPETEELINPSRFTMNPQARMQIESGAQLVIDRFSRFDMEGGSTLEIENGAKVIVKSGAYFNMKTGSNLFVKGSGEVIIESDAHFVYDAGATIQLLDDASCLYIKGDWVLNDAIFTFYGDGFVRLGLPQPQFLAGNVHLNGANCGLLLEGNNGADEVLRVDAGTMLFPGFGLYSFKLQNAYVELGNGASIMIPPTGDPSFNQCPNPPLVLNNLVVDAPAGSQSEGIYIWDQSCHDLSHIAIHHAKTALSAFQIAANNSTPLKISNALLSHNETALATYNRSAHLYGVVMTENQDGWLAYATTQEGSMYACQSTLNTQTGVSYEGTAGLSIKNSGLNANETALLASGKMEVRAFCSSFDQNTTTGINMVKEASLDISYLPFNQTPQNQIRYNPLSITLSKAGQLRLPNGFNDLTPASGGMAIGGTQALPCIPANMLRSAKRNEWNGTGSVPASGTDYEITSIFPPFCNFMLLDDYPDAYSCVEGPPCTGCGGDSQVYIYATTARKLLPN